uniref:Poly [ADP-ribose] polymerase n=1 Tax=Clastoptera arizonana TaxID=38151 RepID=A0A1B6DFG5_9HEMI
MEEDFPFSAEYAKSSRSNCRGCKTQIEKDTLRLAVMVQSPMFDGKTPHWYHFSCFFGKQRVKSIGDIKHFDNLRWEDQEKIKNKVEKSTCSAVEENGDKSTKKGKKRAASKGSKSDDLLFGIEYAKSGRAECRGCHEKILKDEVRISKMDYESDEGRRYGGIPRWHHIECFAKLRIELEFFSPGNTLNGFNTLKQEDKDTVTKTLPKIAEVKKEDDSVSDPKKIKIEPKDPKALEKQSKTLYKYIDKLKTLTKSELTALLEYNDQDFGGGVDRMCQNLADCMTFGSLVRCDKCKTGQLVYYSGIGYKCSGNATEWVNCDNVMLEPPRKPFKAPSELVEKHSFLKIKSKIGKRIIELTERSQPTTSASNLPKVKSERNFSLKNMEFVVLGKTEMSKDEIKNQIVKMGGKLTTKIHNNLAAVISTQDEVDKMGSRMTNVKNCDIQVVPEGFLQESLAGGALENIKKMNISSWGSDPKKRLAFIEQKEAIKFTKSKSQFTKSVPTKVTLKVKGGSAVDPDSGLEDVAHVYKEGNDLYSTVLGLTDISKGVNKYYKMQILESDSKSSYWFFRSWGRIGTTIGDYKLQKESSLKEAKKQFKHHYAEKSGNDWEDRHDFKKVASKMVPMDLNYGEDEVDSVAIATDEGIESKLPKAVQDLISLILNVNTMKEVMMEFELDLQKMPLGKISKKQIQKAYLVLQELQQILKASNPTKTVILDISNKFYTLVPHDYGIDNPPPLDSEEIIKTKMDMLENLLDLEIAYNIMKPNSTDAGIHPVDAHYHKLNTDITVLEKDSKDFEMLKLYVKNTHAETHNQYELEILEAFKISRHGEEKRYKPFKKLPNKKLLWHGSRITNFAGILSQGLRIAPPEAPSTGYMFGKGIYFADMVSKSANYCMTSPSKNVGLLMLCEVALGNMYERTQAEYVEKLPNGMHSTKGLGATEPDPEASLKLEGEIEVPLGPPKNVLKRDQTSLLYNEYIVYDVAQVKAQYLLKIDFKYKY